MDKSVREPMRIRVGRRNFLELLVAGASGLTIASAMSGRGIAADSPSQVNVAYFQVTDVDQIAKGEGYFEELVGPNIDWKEVESGAEINAAMISGSVDLGLEIGSSPTSAGISQKIPYQIILLTADQARAEELVVRQSSGISSPADLRGKKIATPFGSTSHFRLLGFLKINNLTEADVTVLDLRGDALTAAWRRGDIDGAYIWDPFKAQAIQYGGVLYETYKTLASAGYVTAGFYVARSEFIEKYPDIVKAFIRARARAVEFWQAKPDEAAAIVAKHIGISPDGAKVGLSEYDYVSFKDQLSPQWFGTPGNPGKFAEVLKRTGDFLLEQKSIRSVASIEDYQKAINTELLQEVEKEMG